MASESFSGYRAPGRWWLLGIVALLLAVAMAPGWSGIWTLLWVLLAVLSARFPAVGVALLAVSVPLQDRYSVPTIAGMATIAGFVAWTVIAGALIHLRVRRCLVLDRVALGFLLVVVTLLASFAAGGVRVATWYEEVYHWLLPLIIYITVRSVRIDRRGALGMLAGVSAGVTVAAWQAFEQAATGNGPASFEVGGLLRVYGPFSHPNTLASFLVIALPLLIAASSRGYGRRHRVLVLAVRLGALAGVATLLLTQSRGGWLAFAASMFVVVGLSPRSVQRASAVLAITLVVLLIASGRSDQMPGVSRFATIPGAEFGREQVTTATWGQMEREAHWGAAISMMQEHPVFGVGAGEFNDNYRTHTPEWRFRVGRGHAHNGYLHLGAEAGLPGLAAFTIWLGTMFVALARCIAVSDGVSRTIAVGALGAVLAFAVHSVVEYIEVRSLLVLLAMIVALALNVNDPTRDGMFGHRRIAVAGSPS